MMNRQLCILVMIALLAGCATIKPPRDEAPVTWDLAPAMPFEPASTPVDATLHVARPVAIAALATADIAWREQAFERRYYARNRWADEPARLLHPHIVTAIEDAGLFAHTVSSAASTQPRYRLETELLEFEIDFRERREGVARLRLRARLIDLEAGQVLATRRFDATADSRTATPADAVEATNQALEQLLTPLIDWLRNRPR